MIAILADEQNNSVGRDLFEKLREAGQDVDFVPLQDVEVKPCVNCGGCAHRADATCVARDDGDWIYPKVAAADTLVVVSPVVFGGFSVKAKRVLDKFGLFMDRHYYMNNGEMVKGGLIGKQLHYIAVGVQAEADESEAQAFHALVRETILITRGRGAAFVVGSSLGGEADKIAQEVLRA